MRKIFFGMIIIFIFFAWTETFLEGKFDLQTILRHKDLFLMKVSEAFSFNDNSLLKKGDVILSDKQPDHIILDVPLINQMDQPKLYNGCEVTSMAMLLNFHGMNVTKNELADQIKTVPYTYNNGKRGNPNKGFVGDMAVGPGLGVYHGPILALAQQYVGDRAVNLTNKPFSAILKKVGHGLPVWIITTSTFGPVNNFKTWATNEGEIEVTFSMHSAVITGYDEDYIYVNDPYGTKDRKVQRESFVKAWEQMGSQAIVIEK